jgi:hypothetical protein
MPARRAAPRAGEKKKPEKEQHRKKKNNASQPELQLSSTLI